MWLGRSLRGTDCGNEYTETICSLLRLCDRGEYASVERLGEVATYDSLTSASAKLRRGASIDKCW